MFRNVNDIIAIMFLPLFFIWVVLIVLAVKFLDLDTVTGLGLATVTGVLINWGSNIYQYYFRKAPPATNTTEQPTKPPPQS